MPKRKDPPTELGNSSLASSAVDAALSGDLDRLREVLASRTEASRKRSRSVLRPLHGCTPLAAAVLANSPPAIRLLAAHVDVNKIYHDVSLGEEALRPAYRILEYFSPGVSGACPATGCAAGRPLAWRPGPAADGRHLPAVPCALLPAEAS